MKGTSSLLLAVVVVWCWVADAADPPSPPVVSSRMHCAWDLPNPPLTATVPAGITVDWYSAATGGLLLAAGAPAFVSTNSAPGSYTVFAEARDLASGQVSATRAGAALTLVGCLRTLRIRAERTNVVVGWVGNVALETAAELGGPVSTGAWAHIIYGLVGGTNAWTNSALGSAAWFRLHQTPASRPSPPLNPVSQAVCAGSSPNPALAVSVPAGVTVDWYDSAVGGSLRAANTMTFVPTNSVPGVFTYFAEARDLVTGAVSTNRTPASLSIRGRPTAVVSGTATICNGGSTVIQAALTGIGPWTMMWSDGTVQNVATSPTVRVVSPANPYPYSSTNVVFTVTNLVDIYCSASPGDLAGSAIITVEPRPAVVVSGSATICNGASTVIQATLTGIAPWNVTWSDGIVQNVVASPAVRVVSPANPYPNSSANVVFTVTNLVDIYCSAAPSDLAGSALIAVKPRPAAAVSGSATICNGASTAIQASLTGIGPWTLTWSDGVVQNNVAASPATRVVSPANPYPNVSTNVIYTVTSLTDTHCSASAGDLAGSAVISIFPRPLAPVSLGNKTNCTSTLPNPPLSVGVPSGVTADWYAVAAGGGVLAVNTTSFVPTNSAPGNYTYYAEARNTTSGCLSSNRTAVTLTLLICP